MIDKEMLLFLGSLAVILFAPFAILWSLNTLFPVLSIAYTPSTWLAAFIMALLFGPSNSAKK